MPKNQRSISLLLGVNYGAKDRNFSLTLCLTQGNKGNP